jgi:energy-coupling factor transporter ATP-binding protein EcfA2
MTAYTLLEHPFRLLITGRSGYGKTTLATQLALILEDQFDEILIVAPKVSRSDTIDHLFGTGKVTFAHSNPFEGLALAKQFIEDKRDAIEEMNRNPPNQTLRALGFLPEYKPKRQPNFLLFIDDVASEKGVKSRDRTSALDRTSIISRHLNVSIIGIFQQILTGTLSFRKNAEALIAFPSNDMDDTKTLVKEWNPNSELTMPQGRRLFQKAWNRNLFLFIYSPPRDRSRYFIGFQEEIDIEAIKNTR